jgi:GTPase
MNSPFVREEDAAYRAGHVAIVGRPNVGKSTLLNRLIGCKVSITSDRPQTTRQRVTGIITRRDAQIVFVDTPGYQTEHRTPLNRAMNRSVAMSLQEVDAVLWVVEAMHFDARDEALAKLVPAHVPVLLVINKVDRVRRKESLLPFIAACSHERSFAAVVPVSAARNLQLDRLLDAIVAVLPQGPRLHDENEVTTASERLLAAEFLREKLFRGLGEELPYATAVEIEQFRESGGVRHIQATIFVDKEGQKAIVIGQRGEKLKAIATRARRDMEQLFGGRVFLEVWVKVRRGWAANEATLRRMGLA